MHLNALPIKLHPNTVKMGIELCQSGFYNITILQFKFIYTFVLLFNRIFLVDL